MNHKLNVKHFWLRISENGYMVNSGQTLTGVIYHSIKSIFSSEL